MLSVKRFDADDAAATPAKASSKQNLKRKAKDSSSDSSSSSSSDDDAPAVRKAPAAKPAAAKRAAASSSSSSSSSSDSSSEDERPAKKVPAPAPAPFVPVSTIMQEQFGFMLPSGLPPTAAELAAEAARFKPLASVPAVAKPPTASPVTVNVQTLSTKQLKKLAPVAKLNAAQAAKLDAQELEAYRQARLDEKRQKKMERKQQAPADKAKGKKDKKAAEAAAIAEAEAAAKAAAKAKAKAAAPPKVAPLPPPPSQSAATNPALRGEGLKKKDESVRALERAERKRARMEAAGLPVPDMTVEAEHAAAKAQEQASHMQKLDDMRSARMAAVAERDSKDVLKAAMRGEPITAPAPATSAAAAAEVPAVPVTAAAQAIALPAAGSAVAVAEAAALHSKPLWMQRGKQVSPLSSADVNDFHFHPAIQSQLKSMGIERFFATQSEVIPVIMKSYGINDIACCAPTGSGSYCADLTHSVQHCRVYLFRRPCVLSLSSNCYADKFACPALRVPCACFFPRDAGKTLAYVLPIVQSLSTRIVTRLRCVVLLPSRDLALQVYHVFQPFCMALGLKVELVYGQHSFTTEQSKLVGRDPLTGKTRSLVDILICTPGRLMDHLQAEASSAAAAEIAASMEDNTAGGSSQSVASAAAPMHYDFHLHDLQFLVIDEIDRLLNQTYQDWPAKIQAAIFQPAPSAPAAAVDGDDAMDASAVAAVTKSLGGVMRLDDSTDELRVDERCWRRKWGGGATSRHGGDDSSAHIPLQKLLFSATLTNNPQKLASLSLHNPLFFTESTSLQKKFQIPTNLKQWVLNLPDDAQKPLLLIQLLKHLQSQAGKTAPAAAAVNGVATPATGSCQVLIFTSSVESTHRLFRLLEVYEGGSAFAVAEFSSSLSQSSRSRILSRFKRGLCQIIVCSDAMARGMDLPNVDVVVNYDVPTYVQTYVHRVGRTARAGSSGSAYTMVKAAQFKSMRSMLHQADNSFYSKYPVATDAQLRPLMDTYQHALAALKNVLQLEKKGEQSPNMPLHVSQTRMHTRAAGTAFSCRLLLFCPPPLFSLSFCSSFLFFFLFFSLSLLSSRVSPTDDLVIIMVYRDKRLCSSERAALTTQCKTTTV